MLGQRLDATYNRIEEIVSRIQGDDAKRLKVLAKNMRKIAIRWANIYHNERTQAENRIEELEVELRKEREQ